MAQLPDARELGELGTPAVGNQIAQIQSPSIYAVGASGRFLEQAGGSLQHTAAIMDQAQAKQDTIAAEAALNKLSVKGMDLEYGQQGFRNVQGQNALSADYENGYTQQLQNATDQIASGLTNDRQRQLFALRSGAVAAQFHGHLLEHQAQQSEKFEQATYNSSIAIEQGKIASHPDDDNVMGAGMARIFDTLEKQYGPYGADAVAQAKRSALGQAWATRIQAKSYDDPYGAEQMLRSHADDLGEHYPRMYEMVHRAVQDVQSRDIADTIMKGGRPLDPRALYPGIQGATPPPEALSNPGFGIAPVRRLPDGSPDPQDSARVGKQLIGALTARYGSPEIAFAAYSAGSENVDKWLAANGHPGLNHLSPGDWVSKIPDGGTRSFVQNAVRASGLNGWSPAGSPATAKQLAAQLPQYEKAAADLADAMYPGDPSFRDKLVARVHSRGVQLDQQWQNQQRAADEMVVSAMAGPQGDGTNAPQTLDDLLHTSPQVRDAFNGMDPSRRLSVIDHYKSGEKEMTDENWSNYYKLRGMAATQPADFLDLDMLKETAGMPPAIRKEMINLQTSVDKKAAADIHLEAFHKLIQRPVLDAAGIPAPTEKSTQAQKDTYAEFIGRFDQQVADFQNTNKRAPKSDEALSIARNLTTTVNAAMPGKIFGSLWPTTKPVHMFEVGEDLKYQPMKGGQPSGEPVPVHPQAIPPADARAIQQAFQRRAGRDPTPAETEAAWLRAHQRAVR